MYNYERFSSGSLMKSYKSTHSFHDVSPAQYLAEVMCMRVAKKNKETLPVKFWNEPKWKMQYKQQIVAANSLLKIYEPDAIIAAVNRKDSQWIYSLRYPGLNQKILEEKDRLDKLAIKLTKVEKVEYNEDIVMDKPIQPFTKNKLRNLDE